MMKVKIINLVLRYLSFNYLRFFYENIIAFCNAGLSFGNATLDLKNSGEYTFLKNIIPLNNEKLPIIDVGANTGSYAEICLKYRVNDAPIILFEPIPNSFAILNEKFKQEKNILFYELALGNIEGLKQIYYNENEFSTPSLLKENFEENNLCSSEIQISKLSSILLENNIDRIHLLKIDVEGFELEVLKGGGHYISEGKIRYIQFEFGKSNMNNRAYFKDFYNLLKSNYEIYQITKWGLKLISSYNERYEIFTTASNFLAKTRS